MPPGKTFMQRLFDLLAVACRAHHHIYLKLSFGSDLLWWATFLQLWNGVALNSSHPVSSRIHVWSDESGSCSYEAVNPQPGSGCNFCGLQYREWHYTGCRRIALPLGSHSDCVGLCCVELSMERPVCQHSIT